MNGGLKIDKLATYITIILFVFTCLAQFDNYWRSIAKISDIKKLEERVDKLEVSVIILNKKQFTGTFNQKMEYIDDYYNQKGEEVPPAVLKKLKEIAAMNNSNNEQGNKK